ncbi:type IV secretory system conjugative DNA transfer family protein [Niallia endozanthoxylica]|uniref:Type IV secretory system conjugative DNA transfer family protein n=1 Tax=Niallia endozanthoxylica TaxID=2036016 RepID=A0A5J5HHU5_9BACI|nr:TraM recognition domain-containing protein [Niallia endozanthoxylica]KAA9019012.1 type IV secretory system conjugative DNA transfer family protein [Niallia endozanthoxylica]
MAADDVIWGGDDPFTHMLAIGPTRCGKTATVLKPMIYQLLIQKKRGKKLGLSVIEPKGDLARDVKEYCDEMGVPYTYIDPESADTHRFNVMEGDIDDVAEATVAVLQSLFGKQEAFFQTVQELSARNITKLLKELQGDDMDLLDILEAMRDQKLLEEKVKQLKQEQGQTDLVNFFEHELLGSMADKYQQFVIGLRAQLENITGNHRLRHIITGKSDINIDKHFEEGGVLIVNTSLGKLKKAGDAFGQFIIMHLQSGTFRRKGAERTRTPHFLIADEYSRYINPDVEMFLSIAASYRVAGIFATQSLGQLEVESGKINSRAMKQAIMTSCRNKIAFGGLSAKDAQEFSEEFGKDQIIIRQSTYKNRVLLPRLFPDSYRDTESEEYRFHYTYLQDQMARFHYIARLMKDGTPQKPIEAVGSFVPRDWKERREWETNEERKRRKKKDQDSKIINTFHRFYKNFKQISNKYNKAATINSDREMIEEVQMKEDNLIAPKLNTPTIPSESNATVEKIELDTISDPIQSFRETEKPPEPILVAVHHDNQIQHTDTPFKSNSKSDNINVNKHPQPNDDINANMNDCINIDVDSKGTINKIEKADINVSDVMKDKNNIDEKKEVNQKLQNSKAVNSTNIRVETVIDEEKEEKEVEHNLDSFW